MDNPKNHEDTAGRILLADDDEPFRRSLGQRLQRVGFECAFADSAAGAIELLKTREFDALVADINMPGNSGLEMIESLPAIAEGLPIVLLTGRPTMDTAARSVGLRVRGYLTKPPNFDELVALLRTLAGESNHLRLLKGSRRRLQDWEHGIDLIQKMLQQASTPERPAVMQSYLRLTLRNLVVGLVELEHLMIHEGRELGTDPLVEKQELLNAVRKTVGVLERTRDHFKSKELGELRKELEALVNK